MMTVFFLARVECPPNQFVRTAIGVKNEDDAIGIVRLPRNFDLIQRKFLTHGIVFRERHRSAGDGDGVEMFHSEALGQPAEKFIP